MVAHEQGAQTRARPARIGVAADHELLLRHTLQLQPVATAPRPVPPVGAFGDETLPSHATRLLEECRADTVPAVAVGAETDRIVEVDLRPQSRLALPQRQRAEIVVAEAEHVEQIEVAATLALLESREARAVPVERDHLTVDHEPIARLREERVGDLRVLLGPVLLVA